MMKRIGLIAVLLLALCAAGCSGGQTAAPQPSPGAEAPGYVTAFGTVRCAQSLALALPVEIHLLEVFMVEGQSLPAGSPLFQIDMEQLQGDKALLDKQLACLDANEKDLEAQLRQAKADLARAQAAEKAMNPEKLLGILTKLANAGSRARRDPYEAALLAYLVKTDCVGQYHSLIALTADRRNVQDNARPALLALAEQLRQNRKALESIPAALAQRLRQSRTDALPLRQRADIMDRVLSGQVLCGVGSLRADGVFITADRPLLVVSAPQYANQSFGAGEAIAAFDAPDCAVIEANIEEQLISAVSVGARVQISPLHDGGVVWMGTVQSIADRAVVVNGETVVPVAITAEKLALGPGYNVTVRIYPPKQARSGE